MTNLRRRRIRLVVTLVVAVLSLAGYQSWIDGSRVIEVTESHSAELQEAYARANTKLDSLEVKGRAPKTGYDRAEFGNGWSKEGACDMRNIILNRDLKDVSLGDDCKVIEGVLSDPYTGKVINFKRGSSSGDVQIDHVVALSDAWQKGAQNITYAKRVELSNDPLNLLAVDGAANQSKSDGDAATWLPPNKAFRCQYVSRQVEVKAKYKLWVNLAEKQAIERVLAGCLETSSLDDA